MKFTIALLAGLLLTGSAFAQQKEQRVALVIGNNDYQYAKKLDNAVADAQAFRRELEARGFQVVYRENANRRAMNGAMEEFIGKLGTDAIGLVYYSGHGVQINRANYLVPTDLLAKRSSDFVNDAIDLEKLVSRVSQAQAKFSLAVIDACRDNPFQGNGKDIGGSRGLVAPSGNASGMMVVYSAGANQKALDRLSDADRNPNGLFTREFLKAMRIPGLTVQEAVNKIKTSVIAQAKSVGHVQTPAIYDQSVGTFMFTPGAPPAPVDNIVRPNPVVVVPALTAAQLEEKFWDDAKGAGNKEAFEAYLINYPTGRYANLAKANIARLSTANVQVVSAPPVVVPVITPPVTKPVITNPAKVSFVNYDRLLKAADKNADKATTLEMYNKAVQRLAIDADLDLVVQDAVWIDPRVDITEFVIQVAQGRSVDLQKVRNFSQTKATFCFVSMDSVTRDSGAATRAQKKLEAEFSKRTTEILELAKQLPANSPRLQKLREEFQGDLNARRNEELAIVMERANKIIREVAPKRPCTLVFQEAVWANASVDITARIVSELP